MVLAFYNALRTPPPLSPPLCHRPGHGIWGLVGLSCTPDSAVLEGQCLRADLEPSPTLPKLHVPNRAGRGWGTRTYLTPPTPPTWPWPADSQGLGPGVWGEEADRAVWLYPPGPSQPASRGPQPSPFPSPLALRRHYLRRLPAPITPCQGGRGLLAQTLGFRTVVCDGQGKG